MDYEEKENKVRIRVEDTLALWPTEKCPHCCRATVRGYDHAPERRWRHLNVCQLQPEIVCAPPRGECAECRKVYTVRVPWEGRSRGLTQEFETFALTLMRAMPGSQAGEILGETQLWGLFGCVDLLRRASGEWVALEIGTDGLYNHVDRDLDDAVLEQELKRRIASAFWEAANKLAGG